LPDRTLAQAEQAMHLFRTGQESREHDAMSHIFHSATIGKHALILDEALDLYVAERFARARADNSFLGTLCGCQPSLCTANTLCFRPTQPHKHRPNNHHHHHHHHHSHPKPPPPPPNQPTTTTTTTTTRHPKSPPPSCHSHVTHTTASPTILPSPRPSQPPSPAPTHPCIGCAISWSNTHIKDSLSHLTKVPQHPIATLACGFKSPWCMLCFSNLSPCGKQQSGTMLLL
jgi:hypothetical protein